MRPSKTAALLLAAAAVPFGLGRPSIIETGQATSSHLVASGQASNMGAGTYPRVTALGDGSLLGTLTHFEAGTTFLRAVRSDDRGRSWKSLGTIRANDTATHDLDNAFTLAVPGGPILAAYRNHDRLASQAGALEWTFFRIQVSRSFDGGRTWEYVSSVIEEFTPGTGDFEPFMRMSSDQATVELYWSHQNNATDQDTWMVRSTDQGRTWSGRSVVTGGDTAATRDGMVGVARLRDGHGDRPGAGAKLVVVFECKEGDQFTVRTAESGDDGATWGNRQTIYVPGRRNSRCTGSGGDVVCNAGAPQIAAVGGALVVSFMTDEDSALGDWITGATAKLITSLDGGATWSAPYDWTSGQSNWPSVWALDDDRVLAMVEQGDSFAQELRVLQGRGRGRGGQQRASM